MNTTRLKQNVVLESINNYTTFFQANVQSLSSKHLYLHCGDPPRSLIVISNTANVAPFAGAALSIVGKNPL